MLLISELTKTYGTYKALDCLTMEILPGELYGFVGPNGAGKTTTMKIIATLLTGDSGTVSVDGVSAMAYPRQVREKIGYMPDFFGVYDNLTTTEYLAFFCSIYGIEGVDATKRVDELLELVELRDRGKTCVDDLSRGMKQSLCLARTLIHQPKLLILDEPASGLEPRARLKLQKILKELSSQKYTILLSSHILAELSDLCSNIGIIEAGRMIVQGPVKEIIHKHRIDNLLVMKILSGHEMALALLKDDMLVSNIAKQDKNISVNFRGNEEEEAKLLSNLIAHGVVVSFFKREEGNLEEVFLQLTK